MTIDLFTLRPNDAPALVDHLRRLAFTHRMAATYQRRPALDPEQTEEPRS